MRWAVFNFYFEDYLHDVEICQRFAKRNREMILRKGAIAAHKGEKVLIPINMRDGSVLAIWKGNPEWNYSAPYSAGRVMSCTKAKTGQNIIFLRKKAGLTVKDLQDAFGFGTPQAIYKWQQGLALPTIDNLVVLAALLGVKIDDILVIDAPDQMQISAWKMKRGS